MAVFNLYKYAKFISQTISNTATVTIAITGSRILLICCRPRFIRYGAVMHCYRALTCASAMLSCYFRMQHSRASAVCRRSFKANPSPLRSLGGDSPWQTLTTIKHAVINFSRKKSERRSATCVWRSTIPKTPRTDHHLAMPFGELIFRGKSLKLSPEVRF